MKERKQRTKVNGSYSLWQELMYGVWPLLFNLYINDMFYFITDMNIANYADDNTLYTVKENIDDLLKTLENETFGLVYNE